MFQQLLGIMQVAPLSKIKQKLEGGNDVVAVEVEAAL
jgi:hypothetical protein